MQCDAYLGLPSTATTTGHSAWRDKSFTKKKRSDSTSISLKLDFVARLSWMLMRQKENVICLTSLFASHRL